MANQFSKTDQRRLSLLSLISSAAQGGDVLADAYDEAKQVLDQLEADGFFETGPSTPSSKPRGTSRPQGSRPRSGNRGRDNQSGGGFSGQMRDPDGPPTDKQVGKLLSLTDDYESNEVYDMTKQEVSNLIDDLMS